MLKNGFTLLELMITVALIAILTAIAIPSYSNYTRKAIITAATQDLQSGALKLNQYWQDNKSYVDAGGDCGITMPTNEHFDYVCAGDDSSYTITATGKTTSTSVSGLEYTIDHKNVRATVTGIDGTSNATCWSYNSDGSCT